MTEEKTPSTGALRRGARVAAVQALYQLEFGDASADAVIAEFARHRVAVVASSEVPAAIDAALFTDIVRGATAEKARLDGVLNDALDKERSIERLQVLMRAILRAGAYELCDRDDIDPALTINEYVAVADAFFNEREPTLVNAVLDRVARRGDAQSGTAEHGDDAGTDG